jgi:thermitase
MRADPQPVVFESLAFEVEPRRGQTPRAAARTALGRAFGRERWRLVLLPGSKTEFLAKAATPAGRRRKLTPERAWDRTYRLRRAPQVVYAEPLFQILDDEQHEPAGRRSRAAGTDPDPRTENEHEWPLEAMRVIDAWDLFATGTPGSRVVVGHPDTGYTPHPEIAGPRLRPDLGYDFEDGDSNPRDELVEGFLRNPGHGTGTASVIMSARGLPAESGAPHFVSGTAPGASLVPIRTTTSVVLWSMERLMLAVRFATANGAHVISISLGGAAPSVALHNAVRDAEAAGVIVLCAAGNQVGFVVFPAAYSEVIAVAASDIADEPWIGSSHGPAVDITAPGHSVYRAQVKRAGGADTYEVERGSGTSFAVAATAGVAALWLSFHGRGTLIARYGKARLASVFKRQLQDSCRTPAGWDAGEFGPGIVHAKRLLEAPLPPDAPARGMRGLSRRSVPADDLPLDRIVHLLTPAPPSGVQRALSDLLAVDERALPDVLASVGDELAFRVATDARLRAELRAAATASSRPRGRASRSLRPAARPLRRSLARNASRRLRSIMRAR